MTTFEPLESRRLMAGTPNVAFAGDGSTEAPLNRRGYVQRFADSAVDASGRTLLAGYYSAKQQLSVTRLAADGTVDATFGDDGIATVRLAAADRESPTFDVAADGAGRVLLLLDRTLVRLTADGAVDRRFGANGTLAVPVVAFGNDVEVDARDNPLVVGTSVGKTGWRATVVRLGAKRGALDASFGTGGAYKSPVPLDPVTRRPGNAEGAAAKVRADGRVVFVADVRYREEDGTRNVTGVSVVRLDARGAPDATYGTRGTTTLTASGDEYSFDGYGLEAFAPDGGIVVARTTVTSPELTPGGDYDRTWTQLDANGRVKRAGFSVVPRGLDYRPQRYAARVVAVQGDGELLVAADGLFYRVQPGLALDAAFAVTRTSFNNVHLRDDDALLTAVGAVAAITL